jgi:hypothetical protein
METDNGKNGTNKTTALAPVTTSNGSIDAFRQRGQLHRGAAYGQGARVVVPGA